ncbi:REV3L [Branchiostoma lanceolatum]|uniref:REV3L protein n=1 Tax=Branchiostoma lanceolatum TaxID=7740 RepID=A0A8J9YP49_BRALA|nr:REV3L [Branchiostoma lanceolatum]
MPCGTLPIRSGDTKCRIPPSLLKSRAIFPEFPLVSDLSCAEKPHQDVSLPCPAMFSVRIVTADHYQAPPVRGLDVCRSEFRGADTRRVPVVRIFGATPGGKARPHGLFPTSPTP